jgi:hypothetical protein
MPKLTRRRDHNARDESWRVYYGDIRVGSISKLPGVPTDVNQWGWSCGFYPGCEPEEYQAGSAPTFDAARAAFRAAWARLLPKLDEEDFAATGATAPSMIGK